MAYKVSLNTFVRILVLEQILFKILILVTKKFINYEFQR